MKKTNKMFIARTRKVIVETQTAESNIKLPFGLIRNIEPLGFLFSNELIEVVSKASVEEVTELNTSLIDTLKELVSKYDYEPLFVNFPNDLEVVEAIEIDSFQREVMEFLGIEVDEKTTIIPANTEKEERPVLNEKTSYKILELGTVEDLKEEFKNILESPVSISDTDREYIDSYFDDYREEALDVLNNVKIPFIENMIYLYKMLEKEGIKIDNIRPKHITDVVKFIFAAHTGNTVVDHKYINKSVFHMPRSMRKKYLDLFEKSSLNLEDAKKLEKTLVRLGEMLHPGDYTNKFPKTNKMFNKIRNHAKEIKTFNSKVVKLRNEVKNGNEEALVELLSVLESRPGEYARTIIQTYNDTTDKTKVLESFKKISEKVPTRILLSLIGMLKCESKFRTFLPKGGTRRRFSIKDERNIEGKEELISMFQEILMNKFRNPEWENKSIYIDEVLKDHIIPAQMRDANGSKLRPYTSGSKISLDKNLEVVRFFTYWKDTKGKRIDIDLSASFHNKDGEKLDSISYARTNPSIGGVKFSGDITSAPKGAAEFIDCDIKHLLSKDVKYVVSTIQCYTSIPFNEIEPCTFGWMERQDETAGEIYESKTVKGSFEMTSDKTTTCPVIIDIEEMVAYYADVNVNTQYDVQTIEGVGTDIQIAIESVINPNRISMHELMTYHAKASGATIVTKEDKQKIQDEIKRLKDSKDEEVNESLKELEGSLITIEEDGDISQFNLALISKYMS